MQHMTGATISCGLATLLLAGFAQAGPLDEMSLDRWAKLREVERFQLNIAEKFWRESQWKVAADEYEKFLKLYDKSVGASFAQLKWSMCQVNLRNLNTAIKDGFQSVIDYYPDSPDALTAALMIGRTYKNMGDLKMAKKAYDKLLKENPKHYLAVLARADLVDVATVEKDMPKRVALLRELTFDIDRKGPSGATCAEAARELTQVLFSQGDFAEGLKAFETSTKEDSVPARLTHPQYGNLMNIISNLTGSTDEDVKKKGNKLADEAAVWYRTQATNNIKDEKKKAWAIQCWLYSADVQANARRPEKQREVYEQMIAALGETDNLLGHLAGWYKANNLRDKARTIYARFKDPIEGQNQTAISWREEKKAEQAVEIYRRLSVQDDKNAAKWLGEVAWTYRKFGGSPDKAIAVYRDLLNSDIKNAPAHQWNIAETNYEFHRWAEAITVYRGTENFPTNYQRMAYCNRQLKKYDEAITLYRQIIGGHPASASSSMLEIARTYEAAGKKEDAIKSYKLICDRYPKSTEGSTAHRHLNDVYKISVTLGGAKD